MEKDDDLNSSKDSTYNLVKRLCEKRINGFQYMKRLHLGGLHFFNTPAKAIAEMIRVAKPGSLLLIADESEKLSQNTYEDILGRILKSHREPVIPPLHLIPQEMQEVQLQELRNGQFFAITFRKPAEA